MLLLLAACAEIDAPSDRSLPTDAAPPPMQLEVGPVIVGHPVTLSLSGGPPNQTVHLVRGQSLGGPCPAYTAPDCLGIGGQVQAIGRGRTDAAGVATWTYRIGGFVPLGSVHLQTATAGGVSPVVTVWPMVPGAVSRGAWHWRDTGDPWGAGAVVGDPAREAAMLASLAAWSVDRVYASYDYARPGWAQAQAAWHRRLHADGRTVQLLLAENTWIDPVTWPALDGLLQAWLVDFHAGASADGRFDGVHLDVEPHGLPDWTTTTDAGRRDRLLALRDLFAHVRGWLDAHGEAATPLYADLTVWFDELPPALGGGSDVGWASVAERDGWFADLGASLAGISLMAYERPTWSRVVDDTAWERRHFPGEVRAALEVSVGPGRTWASFSEMLVTMGQVEAVTGAGVDVHAWSSLAATSASLGGP